MHIYNTYLSDLDRELAVKIRLVELSAFELARQFIRYNFVRNTRPISLDHVQFFRLFSCSTFFAGHVYIFMSEFGEEGKE